MDIDRIEVLKGPQTTYFGKNAIAGAISVVSRRPTDLFSAGFDATYEMENEEKLLSGYLSGPVSESLRVRFAGQWRDLDKGWVRNVATGTNDPRQDAWGARVSAEWTPSDAIEVYAKYEQARTRQFGRETQLIACNPASPIINFAVEDCKLNDTRAVSFDRAGFGVVMNLWDPSRPFPEASEVELRAGQVGLTWSLPGDHTLSALVNYFNQDAFQSTLPAHQTAVRTAALLKDVQRGFSQELRIESPRDGRLSWVAGLYHDEGALDSFPTLGLPVVLQGRVNVAGIDQEDETHSAFAEVGLQFTDEWTAKIGARWSETEKSGLGQRLTYRAAPVPPMGVPTTLTLLQGANNGTFNVFMKRKDSSFDPSVTVEWRPADDSLLFAAWRQGFKAGGLDHNVSVFGPLVTDIAASNQFAPEEVDYAELGAKLGLLDGRATLNVSLFRGDYKNLQVAVYDVQTALFRTTNAAEARSQGVDVEVAFAATDSLTLNVSASYLDSKYLNFRGAACYANPPQTAAEGCLPVPGAPGTSAQDRSGQRTQFAPEWSGSVTARYRRALPFTLLGSTAQFSGQVDWLLTSSYFTDNFGDPDTEVAGFGRIDARLGLGAEDGRWEAALVGRNLTDRYVPVWVGNQVAGGANSSHFAILDRTRQVALQFKYRYD
jgi:outer membrane receptor protein involved in Fe transport